jgi:hypothetical protein
MHKVDPEETLSLAGDSFDAVATALNDAGHSTRRGKKWNAVQVRRVLLRDAA